MHGAGLTNIIYCESAKVLEVFPFYNTHLTHYKTLAQAKGLKYAGLYLDGDRKNMDIKLDVSSLDKALQAFV